MYVKYVLGMRRDASRVLPSLDAPATPEAILCAADAYLLDGLAS